MNKLLEEDKTTKLQLSNSVGYLQREDGQEFLIKLHPEELTIQKMERVEIMEEFLPFGLAECFKTKPTVALLSLIKEWHNRFLSAKSSSLYNEELISKFLDPEALLVNSIVTHAQSSQLSKGETIEPLKKIHFVESSLEKYCFTKDTFEASLQRLLKSKQKTSITAKLQNLFSKNEPQPFLELKRSKIGSLSAEWNRIFPVAKSKSQKWDSHALLTVPMKFKIKTDEKKKVESSWEEAEQLLKNKKKTGGPKSTKKVFND